MVETSIICLIYKSPKLAKALYESVLEHTPMIAKGQAEFFFVANDPTDNVTKFLEASDIPHYINVNEQLNDEELFSMGYGSPEYMRRVYQGYNFGIQKAKGQKVVLINSDNFFSRDWLENLEKYSDYKKVVSSTLVEPGQSRFGVFPFAIKKDLGRTLQDFQKEKFQNFAEKISKTGFTSGGAYMPCLLYKDVAFMAGLYPEGNIAGKSFDEISRFGDEYFYDKLQEFGVEHITAKDSIVYHLKEGEKSEIDQAKTTRNANITKTIQLNKRLIVHPRELIPYILPEAKHNEIIDELGRKVTVLILNPDSNSEVASYLRTIDNFDFKNIETVLITDNKDLAKQFKEKIRSTYVQRRTDAALYDLFHAMYGEHLLVINKDCNYEPDLFSDVTNRNTIYYFGGGELSKTLVTQYMGNFLFPKKLLLSRTPTFLGFLMEKNKIEVDFSDLEISNISKVSTVEPEAEQQLLERNSLVHRAVRKIRNDGFRSFAVTVKNRVIR